MSDTDIAATDGGDTEQDAATVAPPLPDFSLTAKIMKENGLNRAGFVVRYKAGTAMREIEVVRPDLGDQLDLAEMAGTQTINVQWLGLAMGAMAVKTIDGVPQPPPRNKEDMKRVLRRLGEDGLRAVNHAMAVGDRTGADAASAAKNSSATPVSAT